MDPEVHMDTQSMHRTLPGMPIRLLLAFALLCSGPLLAQVPVDDDGNPIEALDDAVNDESSAEAIEVDEQPPLTPQELEELVGPVALYPDKLLAIVLPASTYPLEIVQAARFLDQLEDDSSLKPDESWDDSVTALLNYPEVVRMMNDDIDWTWRLGEAVVRQQPDVIAAVESFRDRAYAAGNLKTDERQKVSNTGDTIEIQPIEEDIIYVPYYEPERVVHYQPRQVYYYYPRPYPVYYYPYPAHHSFLSGYFWGVTTAFNIGWTTDHLHVFHHSYWGHPYYGRQYFGHYYRRPSIVVYNTYYANNDHRPRDHHRDGDYWRPRDGGPRPGHYRARLERFRDQPRERTVEGYRVPDRNGRSVANDNDRAGFRGGDAGDRIRSGGGANTREGFAASRSGRAEQNSERRDAAALARQADRNTSGDTPIRFRSRERAAAPARSERSRSAGPAARVPERTATTRADGRSDNSDGVRFRPRSSTDSGTSVRQRTQVTPSTASAEAARARAAARSAGNDRGTVRSQPTRTVTPRAASPAPSRKGFAASPGRSAPAARPNVSQPQASPRAASPRTSAPAPRSSAPASAPRAAPTPARQDRAAPRNSGGKSASSRSREH
jgi:hypothetical protein